ncbi:Ferroporti-1 [Chytridium lagenaria]|nr:Ferroporti-1 [Chytridium lagenaria]
MTRLPKASWSLIFGYFFTSWATRMDEWSVALMLSVIFPSNLFYISLHSLFTSFISILLGPIVGALIERTPRLRASWICIIVQKTGIAVATTLLWFLESRRWEAWGGVKEGWIWGLFWGAVVCGAGVRVANMGTTIAVERDWVVVMAAEESEVLTALNTHLRRIDLVCKLAAPLVVSLVSSFVSIPTTMLIITAWCLATLPAELGLMSKTYFSVPMLAIPRSSSPPSVGMADEILGEASSSTIVEREVDEGAETRERVTDETEVKVDTNGEAGRYFTSLGFSGVMITYLLDQGYSPLLLSIMRGLAVAAGLSATLSVPKLVSSIGLIRSGLWGVCGVVMSRWGLWTFDLVETQLLQESVSSADMGVINGVQFSLQNLFELMSYVVTLIWHRPSQF